MDEKIGKTLKKRSWKFTAALFIKKESNYDEVRKIRQ